ncbi:MAG: 50S ribosomal protein L9 [Clostridia bacterium]|nr:50S ribosomal protein L9 [Clostridia bacterium]MCR5055614.1 50S ribosomal protein L9 [Clostridia bacterium]
MKVILKQDVKNLGKKDEMVEVNDGYARNFLIPRGAAVEASTANVNQMRDKQKAAANKQQREIDFAKAFKEKIDGKKVIVKAKAGENGKLFGAIATKDIAEAIKAQYDIDVDKKKIVLDEPIKATGVKEVAIKLYQGISAKISVSVEAD